MKFKSTVQSKRLHFFYARKSTTAPRWQGGALAGRRMVRNCNRAAAIAPWHQPYTDTQRNVRQDIDLLVARYTEALAKVYRVEVYIHHWCPAEDTDFINLAFHDVATK